MNAYTFKYEALEQGVVSLYLEFAVGSSGAVPAALTRSRGISSVTLSTTGTYSIALTEPAVALVAFNGSVLQGTYDKTHGSAVVLKTNSVTSTTAPLVVIELRTTDGNATVADAASGDILRLKLELQTVKP